MEIQNEPLTFVDAEQGDAVDVLEIDDGMSFSPPVTLPRRQTSKERRAAQSEVLANVFACIYRAREGANAATNGEMYVTEGVQTCLARRVFETAEPGICSRLRSRPRSFRHASRSAVVRRRS